MKFVCALYLQCGFAGCDFEAHFKILLEHQTSVHMNLKKKTFTAAVGATTNTETEEDIEKWRAERRKKYPKVTKNQPNEEARSDQIEEVNNNECQVRSDDMCNLNEDNLETHSCIKVEKTSQNDFDESKVPQSCSSRKRGFIRTYGSSEKQSNNNKWSKKKRRNHHHHHQQHQHEKKRDEAQVDVEEVREKEEEEGKEAKKERKKELRWQSKSTTEGKSSGNFGATSTTKGASASSFKRRPTLFEKVRIHCFL